MGNSKGTQRVLMYSLVAHPLALKIDEACSLEFHRWYADDCTLIGRSDELLKAIDIAKREGPEYGIFLNPVKTKVFWPNIDATKFPFASVFPAGNFKSAGIELLGAPIGSPEFCRNLSETKYRDARKRYRSSRRSVMLGRGFIFTVCVHPHANCNT